jgi:sulfatase modifying factor 1
MDHTDELRREVERLRRDYEELRGEVHQLSRAPRPRESTRPPARIDPAIAGRTVESVLRFVYRKEGRPQDGEPDEALTFEALTTGLRDVLPGHIQAHLRTVQAWRDVGLGEEGDGPGVELATLDAVETAVTRVVMWFVVEKLGGEIPLPERTRTLPEALPPELAEWRELYWWAMRNGAPKLLEKAALDAAQKRRQLDFAAIDAVRRAYKRDDASLRDGIADALDDGALEEHWLDALEELRLIGCISAREAERIAAAVIGNLKLPTPARPEWLVAAVRERTYKIEEEARRVREAEEAEARARAEAEARERAEREAEAQRRREAEEAEERALAEAEARVKELSQARLRAQAEAELRLRLELEARAKAEREAQAAREWAAADARARAEREAKAMAEAEARARAEAEERAKRPQWVHPWMITWGQDALGPWATTAIGGIMLKFRGCLPGKFVMGSPPGEEGRWEDEGPAHEVELTQLFWMAETPVTQTLWQATMGSNPSKFRGAERPVEQVSWEDCQQFLLRVNGAHPGLNLRLPTEAEWEYACRAGTYGPTWLGANSAATLHRIAWIDRNSENQTRPVKQKESNPWGLHDMLGNVWEWCADYTGAYGTGRTVDPIGPATGTLRVYRGGSWFYGMRDARAARRLAHDPGARFDDIGFRVVRGQ